MRTCEEVLDFSTDPATYCPNEGVQEVYGEWFCLDHYETAHDRFLDYFSVPD